MAQLQSASTTSYFQHATAWVGDLVNTAQKYMLESSSLEGAELFGQRAIAAGNGVDWNRVRLISGTLKFTKLNLTVLEAARFQLQGQILNMKAQPYHICLFKTIQSIVDSSHWGFIDSIS